MIGVLVHEARHAGQFVRGEYDASDDKRPRKETLKTQIMRTRAVEADAQATAVQTLGEMMEAGDVTPLQVFPAQTEQSERLSAKPYTWKTMLYPRERHALRLLWHGTKTMP